MSKSWSSFEGQQLLQENWRNFLSEMSSTAKRLRDQGLEVEDRWEEPEGQEEPQGSDYPDVSTGLDSDYKQDSLKQVLGRLTPPLDPEHIQALINVIAQIAGDEGIMLELSLKGLNSEQDRIIDSAGTALILKAIAGFNLPDAKNTALIKALNYWGRVNSVKFTAPPAAAPAVVNTTDPHDDTTQDTTLPDEPEPDPSSGTEPESDTPAGEEDTDDKAKEKVLSIMGSTLDIISASGVFPPAEATLIPTGATLASLGLNLYQKKMGWALMDLIALVPWAGKFAKAGSLGKIAKAAADTGKTGKALASATKAMKLAEPALKATKLVKGATGVHKILYELVPEEMIRTAVYAKTDDGKKYYIDFVLEVLGYAPHPIIKAGVEALKETVAWIRKDLGAPRTPRIGKQTQGSGPADPDDAMLQSPTEPEPEPEPLGNFDFNDFEDRADQTAGSPFPDLEPLEPPPEGYDKGSNEIFHSMIPYPGDHGWDIIADDTWALYKDLNATPDGDKVPESGLFAWSPRSQEHRDGVWIRPDIDPQELTNSPIKENLLERWRIIAGINKRVL